MGEAVVAERGKKIISLDFDTETIREYIASRMLTVGYASNLL